MDVRRKQLSSERNQGRGHKNILLVDKCNLFTGHLMGGWHSRSRLHPWLNVEKARNIEQIPDPCVRLATHADICSRG